MSFCIKKYLVFSLRKSNNTKYYRTEKCWVLFLCPKGAVLMSKQNKYSIPMTLRQIFGLFVLPRERLPDKSKEDKKK